MLTDEMTYITSFSNLSKVRVSVRVYFTITFYILLKLYIVFPNYGFKGGKNLLKKHCKTKMNVLHFICLIVVWLTQTILVDVKRLKPFIQFVLLM